MRYNLSASKSLRGLFLCGFMMALTIASGCGTGAPPKAQAKGKVTFNGEPVKGGTITFAPFAGSGFQGIGKVKDDGTFVMMTEKEGDGAPIGKGILAYAPEAIPWDPPEWDGKGEPPQAPKNQFDGLVPKQTDIEIKAGDNDITVELVPAGPQ